MKGNRAKVNERKHTKIIEKINENETKDWYYKNMNKIDKCLVRMTKKKHIHILPMSLKKDMSL